MLLRVVFMFLMLTGLAGLAVIAWIALKPSAPPPQPAHTQIVPPPPPPSTLVLALARAQTSGTLLPPSMIVAQPVPRDTKPADSLPDTPANRAMLSGAMLRHDMEGGHPLLAKDVISPQDRGFLAAVLAPGTVGEAVSINAVTGTAGLIWPGDHVDVVLSMQTQDRTAPANCQTLATTVLTDIRVVAVDRHLTAGQAPGNSNDPARTATLELTSAAVPRLTLAAHMGEITLVVRSGVAATLDTATANTALPLIQSNCPNAPRTLPGTLNWGDAIVPTNAKTSQIRVYSGNTEEKVYTP